MFLKFICKVFFAKNIVKSVRNSRINGRNRISALFPGQSTPFRQNRQPCPEKPGGTAATNTAGKSASLWTRNKAERNRRHTQETQQIKSRSCRTKNEPPHFLNGIAYGLANGDDLRFRSILCPGRAVRPAHTPQIKKKTLQTSWVHITSVWLADVELEPYQALLVKSK